MRQEVEWDNVPTEFEDAIMGEMMEDPVILPTSGNIWTCIKVQRNSLPIF